MKQKIELKAMHNLTWFIFPGFSMRGIPCGELYPTPWGMAHSGCRFVQTIKNPLWNDKKRMEIYQLLLK